MLRSRTQKFQNIPRGKDEEDRRIEGEDREMAKTVYLDLDDTQPRAGDTQAPRP